MKVALSTAVESSERQPVSEIILEASNPLARGRKKWEHEVICAFVRSEGKSPKDHASYEDGFRRLFANALSKMGIVRDGGIPQAQNPADDLGDAEATQTYDFPVDPILDFIPE